MVRLGRLGVCFTGLSSTTLWVRHNLPPPYCHKMMQYLFRLFPMCGLRFWSFLSFHSPEANSWCEIWTGSAEASEFSRTAGVS